MTVKGLSLADQAQLVMALELMRETIQEWEAREDQLLEAISLLQEENRQLKNQISKNSKNSSPSPTCPGLANPLNSYVGGV